MMRLVSVVLLFAMVGCSTPPEPPPVDTGARQAVREFYEAVIRRDWPTAYSYLHPDNTKTWTPATFQRRGEAYLTQVGFEPKAVHIRTLEEQGETATTRLELTAPTTGKHHHKDAITLRRHDGKWRVVLPAKFGGK